MKTYEEAEAALGTKKSKKVDNNTHLERLTENSIGVKLHSTHVVVYFKNGTTVLNSGGYKTVTTKDRMNKFSSAQVYQTKGEWFVNDKVPFKDGMTV
jgi:hypothetical protein